MDLSYYIYPNVPACKRRNISPSMSLIVPPQGIHSDYARIRQGNRTSAFISCETNIPLPSLDEPDWGESRSEPTENGF